MAQTHGVRTETLAIVFTDIKGYTAATSAQTHIQNAALLKSMAAVVTPVVKVFEGRIVKSIGDAYMIVFRSPTDAMRCSVAIQDRLHQHNSQRHADAGIHIRVAVNIGEVRIERGDVFGEPVNIASRIEGVTPADEVYFSEAMYLTMNRSDIACERVGDYELKGIPEPVTVYRAKRFADAQADESGAPVGLPFGGKHLALYQRVRWLRRMYQGAWLFALVGLTGAAYLRYRPETDYSHLVAEMKAAVEATKPTDALALAGQIPPGAVQERTLARRYRRQAAAQLYDRGEIESARSEVEQLLADDPRDADALLLKGLVLAKKDDLKGSFAALNDSLKLNPALAQNAELVTIAVKGMADPGARKVADAFIDQYLRVNAVPALLRLMQTSSDRNVRWAVATRLEKLGAGAEVDWVAFSLEDLKSTNCKTKKNAIARLMQEGDERAVGPLLKLGESKNCVSSLALKAADTILGK